MPTNKGWTIFGKTYHLAVSAGFGQHCPPAYTHCTVPWLDQTTHKGNSTYDGLEPTGALVPTGLRPCKRCFPDGDPDA